MTKDLYEIIMDLTKELQNKDKEVTNLKILVNKISARKANLEKQITEREILIDEIAKEINERDIKNHKLERENERYREYYKVIALNEDVYNKYMAMFNTAKSRKQQNRQVVRELQQAIDTWGLKTEDGDDFKKGALDNFVGHLKGQCKMFTEEQCMILLNR